MKIPATISKVYIFAASYNFLLLLRSRAIVYTFFSGENIPHEVGNAAFIKYLKILFFHYTTKISSRPRYVGHLESKERLRIQPAQLFNFS